MKTPYKMLNNGQSEHRLKVINVFGKKLPRKSIVHHVDGNPQNNCNSNLVVCQNQRYHYLLHVRERAIKSCGNKHWRMCPYCHEYDDPSNMKEQSQLKGNYYHSKCASENRKINRRKNHKLHI